MINWLIESLLHPPASSGLQMDLFEPGDAFLPPAVTSTLASISRVGTALAEPAKAVLTEFPVDCKHHPLQRAVWRAVRKSRIYNMRDAYERLVAAPAYQHHLTANGCQDRMFFLSDKHYLVEGLTARERLDAALAHYGHESHAFDDDYVRQVYLLGGLPLWRKTVKGVDYDIRLLASDDVFHEGALSVELRIDRKRVCIMAYSVVPTGMVLPGHSIEGADTIIFLTRKHLTRDHAYQSHFNKAFDRTTPAHLCFGALTGIALAQGRRHAFGIDPMKHPAFGYSPHAQFTAAYEDFWTSLSGRRASIYGYLLDLPVQLTPLDSLEPSRRKRAIVRRRHSDEVSRSAQDTIAAHLR